MNARTEFRAPDKADASARLPRNEKEKPRPLIPFAYISRTLEMIPNAIWATRRVYFADAGAP